MTNRNRGTAAAVLAALVLAGPLMLAAPAAASATAPQPRTQAGAKAAAAAAFKNYANGDYGPFWDRWTAASKRVVSRANYMKRFKLCPQLAEGLPFVIRQVTISGTTARVRAARLGVAFSYDFVYQTGAWRYVLAGDLVMEYRTKSVTRIAAEQRALRACG